MVLGVTPPRLRAKTPGSTRPVNAGLRPLISPLIIEKLVLRILKEEKVKGEFQVSVCLVNNRKIRELNLKYLREGRSTDVLSFDLSRDGDFFADIIISTDTAASNARVFKTSPEYEAYLYIAHGLYHALGYDDKTIKGREVMRKKQEGALSKLGIKINGNS